MKYVLHFYISTFCSMCAGPNMAVFCSSLILCFPDMSLRYCLSDFEMVPVTPIITHITLAFTFHMHWLWGLYILKSSQLLSWPFTHSFIHSIGMRRMQRFLAVLRSFFHSFLVCNFSRHPSPPTILPSSLTLSCHLFLGLPLNLVVPKFIYI